jgi:hypothetical protein
MTVSRMRSARPGDRAATPASGNRLALCVPTGASTWGRGFEGVMDDGHDAAELERCDDGTQVALQARAGHESLPGFPDPP